MSKLEIELPPDVAVEDAKRQVVMWMHQQGHVSAGRAAELLGMDYASYVNLFSEAGGSLFNYSSADLDAERKNWG